MEIFPTLSMNYEGEQIETRKAFFPDAIVSWNKFITHFATMPTFKSLKTISRVSFALNRIVFLESTIL